MKRPTPRSPALAALAAALVLAVAGCGGGGTPSGSAAGPGGAASAAAGAPAADALPAGEGYAAMDDGTRLYYRVVGDGPQVVVVPMAIFLEDALSPLADGRRLVFYDPRNRGRSDAADLATVSLDRQVEDLEQLRVALGIERMALLGWSGSGMETAVYALRHPERVTRLVQVDAVPPSAAIMAAAGDRRDDRIDPAAVADLDRRAQAGEVTPEEHCRLDAELTLPSNFADPARAAAVPDVCRFENEWPDRLWPYFDALLGSFGDYDWLPDLARLEVPRLVVHGREDGIPIAGAYAWAAGFPSARLLLLSPAGHFSFLEQPDVFFPAVDRFLDGDWPAEAEPVPAGGAAKK